MTENAEGKPKRFLYSKSCHDLSTDLSVNKIQRCFSEPDLESTRLRNKLWVYFDRGEKVYKNTSSKEAFCKSCVQSTGKKIALRGDGCHMWKHINSCINNAK